MGDFSTGFGTGYSIGSDIIAKKAIKKEKERSKKLVEELQVQIESYQLSDEPMTYADKLKLGVMVSQLGQTYASVFNNINSASSSYDQAKMVQEAQNLRSKNDNLMTIVKEMKDNKFLHEAELSKLDDITGLPISKIFNKDSINKIQDSDTRQAEIANIISAGKSIGKEYAKPLYEEKGIIPKGLEPAVTPPTEIDLMDKNKKILDFAYNTGNAERFNQVAENLGVQTTFDTYKQGYEKPEVAGGTAPKVTTPAPTSTENIREDILDADTFADAKRIYDNYAKKYDVNALGITDLKQEWGKGQIAYLNKVMKSIENLLVDRGDKGKWLNNKPVTKETVGLEFKGEQPASEVYEMLYKSYIEYLEKLRKLGIDVSQFPKIKPLSEIEKVGGTEGFFAIKGVKKGDYKSIYY